VLACVQMSTHLVFASAFHAICCVADCLYSAQVVQLRVLAHARARVALRQSIASGRPMPDWAGTFDAKCNRNPEAGTRKVGLSKAKWRAITADKQSVAVARLKIAKEVLADPLMMLEGWSRPNTDGCCAYIGRPTRDFRQVDEKGGVAIDVPSNPQMPFFVVFVTGDGTIDEWTWREAMDSDPSTPKGVEGKQIWPL